ncbi:terpene synthase [Rummeliibacillus sp. TYF005]|uniref:terpene synthase n=1 Tax=unclassified Rummeliibacillus TaxID=2622809 RepID=UPI000E672442|nr:MULTISPECIES: terpene synthase [unclassified Rummeliibacillus]RIJ63336.1 terpene synthase [Rummeliibacillus sp. POC4]RPJ96109.1 terpene synthase [Rummeliibacillus sp. TYF005]
MISLNRVLNLSDLEVYRVFKDENILSYAIIEDTKQPFTEEDKKIEPLCYMDEEDINEILNVFRIYLINDEPLKKEDSVMLREFFSEFVNTNSLTNFIIQEYVQKDVYDDDNNVQAYQKMLDFVGSSYKIKLIKEKNWLYLSQD